MYLGCENRGLGQWEAIPAAAGAATQIFGGIFGGDDKSKKMASIMRRHARAQRALQVLQPHSQYVSERAWSELGSLITTWMQGPIGCSGGVNRGGPNNPACDATVRLIVENFPREAAEAVLNTSPGQVIDNPRGWPSWQYIQEELGPLIDQMPTEAEMQAQAEPAPTPRPAPAAPRRPRALPPTQIFAPPEAPQPTPVAPAARPIVVSAPAPAPVPIEPERDWTPWLLGGGLLLAAVMIRDRK